jgi:hypothetical protein
MVAFDPFEKLKPKVVKANTGRRLTSAPQSLTRIAIATPDP